MRKNICIAITFTVLTLAAAIISSYLYLLPAVVSNQKTINYIEKTVKKSTNCNLEILNPKLKTSLKPIISFGVDKISLENNNASEIFVIDNFDTTISFEELLQKTIALKELTLDYVFVNADEIIKLLPKTENKKEEAKPLPIDFDFLNAHLHVKKVILLSTLNPDIKAHIEGSNIEIDEERDPKYLKFNFKTRLSKNNNHIDILLNDNDKFYILNKQLIAKDGILDIDNSRIYINAVADHKNININLSSKDFVLADIEKIIKSNIFIPNGKELLAEVIDVKGYSDFNVDLTKKGFSGDVIIKPTSFKIKSLTKMPINIDKGNIKITPEEILMTDFTGYYGTSRRNKFDLKGNIKDYFKTVDTKIDVSTFMTNEFTHKYLSPLIGADITVTGNTPAFTKLEIYSKNSDVDIIYMAKLDSGNDLLIEGSPLTPATYDRAIKTVLHFKNNILNIEDINYYIASNIDQHTKSIKPILTLHGNVDIANNSKLLDFAFKIPKPLPSEFLNIFLNQKVFSKGLISGDLQYDNNGKYPVLKGNLRAKDVTIPKAKLRIYNCALNTNNKTIKISADGKFRRGKYNLNGTIINKLVLPVIVSDIKFDLDFINLKKLLDSFIQTPAPNATAQVPVEIEPVQDKDSEEDAPIVFQPNIIEINNAEFNLKSGRYKQIKFGNLHAKASLDRNGKLKIDSNKFDFAEGTTSAKIRCDLAKNVFGTELKVKDINSDLLATVILNLKKEISGKASGLIRLGTDSSMKLNGSMDFIIQDGTIEKVGLVEYALNFVSVFRNPISMLSPSLLFDIVNIPEGKFESIKGSFKIKDNIITSMKIQSTAPQLVTLIFGRIDLVTGDSSLRIYTKFATKNKGVTGFLRKISLSSLAKRLKKAPSNIETFYSNEIEMLPELETNENESQIYLTIVEGDVQRNNFLSSLKKIK